MTWSEAITGLESFVKFAERSTHYNAAEVMNLHIILNECYTKWHSAIKQADIRDMFKKMNKHVDPSPATLRSPSPQLALADI